MTIGTKEYAQLAYDAYDETRKTNQEIELNGVKYLVLDTASNSLTGYQGTTYQRIDTGEVVIAHRGTESLLDGAVDAGMIATNLNAQARDAQAFTERAIQVAKATEAKYGHPIAITTTGHSLGGCLAQITAYRNGLHGETFNPYFGAASLNIGIPEGGSQVINHARATDIASATGKHFGEVRLYMPTEDIGLLNQGRYLDNNPNNNNPLFTATVDAHKMGNFLPGNAVTGTSILTPENEARAQAYAKPIAEYRQDVLRDRIDLHTVLSHQPLPLIPGPVEAIAAQARLTAQVGDLALASAGEKIGQAYDTVRKEFNAPQVARQQHDRAGPNTMGAPAQPPPQPAQNPAAPERTGQGYAQTQAGYDHKTKDTERLLNRPPTPEDPFRLPPEAGGPLKADKHIMRRGDWVRDPKTEVWSQPVTVRTSWLWNETNPRYASAAQEEHLNKAAEEIIRKNLSNSPQAIAERYRQEYEQNGWSRFGPMPPSVETALRTPANQLRASDGHTYSQEADGQWSRAGGLWGAGNANPAIQKELDATLAARQRPNSPPMAPASAPERVQGYAAPGASRLSNAQKTLIEGVRQVGKSGDLGRIIETEKSFLVNDLNKYGNNTAMKTSLEDALAEMETTKRHAGTVGNEKEYKQIDKAHSPPGTRGYRLPADEAQQAFSSHYARLLNQDKSHMDDGEKELMAARESNMLIARRIYTEQREQALGISSAKNRGIRM